MERLVAEKQRKSELDVLTQDYPMNNNDRMVLGFHCGRAQMRGFDELDRWLEAWVIMPVQESWPNAIQGRTAVLETLAGWAHTNKEAVEGQRLFEILLGKFEQNLWMKYYR